MWDLLNATGQPVGRLLGGRYRERVQPYASLLMDEPAGLRHRSAGGQGAGFPRVQDRVGALRPAQRQLDRAIVAAAREAVGCSDSRLMVDAGGSDAHWPNGYKWALNTARMLADYDMPTWFEEALVPDALEDFGEVAGKVPCRFPVARC